MTGPENKPRKNAAKIAPPRDNIQEFVLGRMFVLLQKASPLSDFNYFINSYFSNHQVEFRIVDDKSVIAAIRHYSLDEGKAFDSIRTEATCKRGRRSENKLSARVCVAYIEQNDKLYVDRQAKMIKVDKIRWTLKKEQSQNGGLYYILDGNQCLYVGSSRDNLPARIDEHFRLRRNTRWLIEFDKYCQHHLSESYSWTACLLAPSACRSLVAKSLFWDREEYDSLMPVVESEYCARVAADPIWFLHRAEMALIALLRPKYNVALSGAVLASAGIIDPTSPKQLKTH